VLTSFKAKEQEIILNHIDTSSINYEGNRVVKVLLITKAIELLKVVVPSLVGVLL